MANEPMKQTERLYLIDRILRGQTIASFADLQRQLEVSRATLKRDLAFMRDRLNAPIVFDRDRGGYRLDRQAIGPRHELPGLWFDDGELLALLSIHRMLEDLDIGGLLGERLQPLVERLEGLLGERFTQGEALKRRVRFIRMHDRLVAPKHFALVGRALLERKRLHIRHFSRARNIVTEREISPQRLVHYRNAWYLDAWCHWREGLRSFSLDASEQVLLLESEAIDVDDEELAAHVEAGYGIFAGDHTQLATLLFEPEAARWVGREQWHPSQQMTWQPDGRLKVQFPYSDSTELEMDILRHGQSVTVLDPPELARRIRDRLAAALARYGPMTTR